MTIHQILKHYWNHDQFRPLQEEIILSVLAGNDTLALMPTGGGKSVCFQVPALLKPGICIVVSPLIALMKDQVENLKKKGIDAIAIFSGMGKREVDILLDNCIYGPVKFLYLSPERLLSDLVRERIRHMNVNLFAIDEAHCISQWGYDFRPPYLQLAQLRELHPDVPFLALTATATHRVEIDIQEKLKFKKANTFRKSFERSNLSYVVFDIEDKRRKLLSIIRNVSGTGIVYVRNRRETQEVSRFLNQNHIASDFYHAGLESTVRSERQEAWKSDKTRVIVATNAFGMGIDKTDVRFVIHLDLPESLEAYYQEAGRAGRDEKKAYAILLYHSSDKVQLQQKFELSFPPVSEIKQVYHQLGNYFQLAYGAGEGIEFEFDLVDFSNRFQLDAVKVFNALKFLEHDQFITFSESIFLPSRIKIIISPEELYRFQVENAGFDPIIKSLLRSYGGLFDQYVPVRESEFAKNINANRTEIIDAFYKLQQLEVISYIAQTDKPHLSFISSRIPDIQINTKYIEERKMIMLRQVEHVISYAEKEICRSAQLLNYFGEETNHKCGVCDVCIAEKKKSNASSVKDEITKQLIELLTGNHLSLNELVLTIKSGTEKERLEIIRNMLDAGLIKVAGNNYYI